MKTLTPLILCALLASCGGGGGGGGSTPVTTAPTQPTPTPTPTATLGLSSTTLRTIGGGSAIPLTAALSSGGTVRWQLPAGTPGSLSADSGTTVRYLPPASGLAAPAVIPVTASGDGASATLALAVTPDPGVAGMTRLTWREAGTENEPTMRSPSALAADIAGNIYALMFVDAAPTRRGSPWLSRIAPDGTVTPLIGSQDANKAWFGQPDSANNASRLNWVSSMAADREGNLYFTTLPGGFTRPIGQVAGGRAILKVTPGGVVSVLAGSEDQQTVAITDGTGSAARFAQPYISGIDHDGNLYLLDGDANVARKVTPAGVVTTIAAIPASLNADMNGNTYRFDDTTKKLVRTSATGATTVETGVPYCTGAIPAAGEACLGSVGYAVYPIGGATYAVLQYSAIYRLVLPH